MLTKLNTANLHTREMLTISVISGPISCCNYALARTTVCGSDSIWVFQCILKFIVVFGA